MFGRKTNVEEPAWKKAGLKRDPYRLREEEMTPEELEFVFPSDDGINFQWGDTYIKYREVSDKGGKYWRQNADGSITEFDPVELRVRIAANSVWTKFDNCKIIEESDIAKVEFASEEDAKMAEHHFLDVFWTSRSIEAHAEGKILTISCILKGVQESTYFPAKA